MSPVDGGVDQCGGSEGVHSDGAGAVAISRTDYGNSLYTNKHAARWSFQTL